MANTTWLVHIRRFTTPNERWILFFGTNNPRLQEEILSLILNEASTNHERWGVFSHTRNEWFRENVLEKILEHAQTFDELWEVYLCASEQMKDKIFTLIEATCKKTLQLAVNNTDRWLVHTHTSDPALKERALSEILAASASEGERWEVFFCSKNEATRKKALDLMMRFRLGKNA